MRMIELTQGEVIFLSDALKEIDSASPDIANELIGECIDILKPHIDNNEGEVDEYQPITL